MSSAAPSQIRRESSEREMGDRSWLLHRGKLGDKEKSREPGDRRNPPDFPLSGALWEHRNRHESFSGPPAAYRLREEEDLA